MQTMENLGRLIFTLKNQDETVALVHRCFVNGDENAIGLGDFFLQLN